MVNLPKIWNYLYSEIINSHRLNGYYIGALLILSLLYLPITFFVLHKSHFSHLISDLCHTLFHLIRIWFFSRNHLLNVVNTVNVKSAKSKETLKTYKARSLSHSALGYQSSSKWLLADVSILLNIFQFRSWIRRFLESNFICRIYKPIKKTLTLKNFFNLYLLMKSQHH